MDADRDATSPGRALRFRTADLDVARAQVTKTFAEHEMAVTNGRDLDFRLDLAPASLVTLGLLSYGTDVTITAPPMRTKYHVNLPVSGISTVDHNGQSRSSVPGRTGIALLPDGPLTIRWNPDGVQYAIKLPKELLEAHAAKLAGHPTDGGIRFALEFDLTTGPGQALLATTGFLYAELARPGGLVTMPAARHELESALMTQLLLAIPSQLTPVLRDAPARSRRAKIREVMEYIDEHPEGELSTADLASMAGLSARALQAGFRDLVGMSPTAYVRGVRLDRVHLALASADARSVTEVAGQWGFFHPGRFAQQYRQRFGVLPSETARH